jgi:hypothetical protein
LDIKLIKINHIKNPTPPYVDTVKLTPPSILDPSSHLKVTPLRGKITHPKKKQPTPKQLVLLALEINIRTLQSDFSKITPVFTPPCHTQNHTPLKKHTPSKSVGIARIQDYP